MRITSTQKGSAMTYGLVIMSIMAILFVGLIQFVVQTVRLSLQQENATQALHTAEAGIYFYRWHLAHNVEGKTATQVQNFWNNNPLAVDDDYDHAVGGLPDCSDTDDLGSGEDDDADSQEWYTADYSDGTAVVGQYQVCVVPPGDYSTIVTIISTGWTSKKPDVKRVVSARLRKPSWSEFAILSDEFMRLSSGTEIFGRIHSNEGFHFDGIAHNIISSSVDTYYDNDGDVGATRPGVWRTGSESIGCADEPDAAEIAAFLAGKECPITSTDFDNATADFTLMKAEAQDVSTSSVYFDTSGVGRHILLGSPTATQMEVRRVTGYNSSTYDITSWDSAVTYTIPQEGVIYVEENAWVEGVVPSGAKLTIAAHNPSSSYERNIYLGMGDITYEDYDSETILGLSAENNVQLLRYSEDDLRIDGALLAQKGYIGWQGSGWSNVLSQITLNGALVSNKRLGFGYTSGSGYTDRDLIFDTNLLFSPPPLFPTGDSYAIDLWENL